jgi:transcriptional regulator with XRE-family HTH domain
MALKLRIREIREARGWSLETLASRIGTSVPHLSQVERGVKNLNNRLIDALARELGVEPFELFAPRQDSSDIDRLMNRLSADDLARVAAFAAALASTRKPDGEQ